MKNGTELILGGEIILSGEVLNDEWAGWMWEDDVFFSPAMVRQALAAMPDGPLTMRINSYGGHTAAGEAIRAMIAERARLKGPVTMIVEGVAMSAATLILMGASRREMTAGSILMIHNPSGGAWGEAEDLRKEADVLDLLQRTFAAVYAEACGQTIEAVMQIMAEETYYGPEDALAGGWVHAIAGAQDDDPSALVPVEIVTARAQMAQSVARIMSRKETKNVRPAGAGQHPPAKVMAATETAPTANPKENSMSGNPAAVTPAAPVMSAEDAVQAERSRARAIREMATPFVAAGRVMQADVDALIDQGLTPDTAATRLLTTMAAREPTLSRGTATITRDETDTKLEGMIGALMGEKSGPAEQFKGLRVKRLAQELAGPSRNFNEAESIRKGMGATSMTGGAHGVSDFAYITTEVMNRTLMREYQARPATWSAVCGAPVSAADFREQHAVRFGGDFQLKNVQANGEYESATLSDEAEGLRVERKGRTIKLTFEAVVNDDMGAFTRIPREFAQAARNMESSMVWTIIRTNAVLKSDSKALFHADHGNLAASGAVISVTTVGAGRAAMWQQKALGRKSTDDDFLMIEADRLIVPPALELAALQFVNATTPNSDGSTNPYKTTLTPVVVPHIGAAALGGSNTAWYLVSSALPPVQHAYLEGYEAPSVVTVEGMNPDVVTMNARHIFGAAPSEYRGAWKNPGA
ncbi:Clp protease ClpP [Pseudotabrizicola algicola]|uniref:Clp protease ClpP n=1 Tax=Pseudotabrizicola algicola TaxID=2709381 RepID=A0A6B3RGV1_9RHOB|nr:Clp protease ClpP [Pseudotabrizicola algicola]NEX45190.1 Clp protease ClpP [Pseudotabrizicola algicola]